MYVLGMGYPTIYITMASDFKHDDKIYAFNYVQLVASKWPEFIQNKQIHIFKLLPTNAGKHAALLNEWITINLVLGQVAS